MAANVTNREIEIGRQLGSELAKIEPRPMGVCYDPASRKIRLTFPSGAVLEFDRNRLSELNQASDEQMQALALSPGGTSLTQEELDVDYSAYGVVFDLLMPPGWREVWPRIWQNERARAVEAVDVSAAARALGKIKTASRAAASRENGKKGGRPKKAAIAERSSEARVRP